MANWHYYTANNKEKIGPITGKELKQLVQQGTITPQTFVEDPTGRTGLAKDVNGLTFPELTLTLAVESPTVDNPSTVAPFPITQAVQVPPVAPPPVNVFCTNCGNSISEQAVACMSCGARPTGHKKFCRHCGVALNPEQVICIKCGAGLTGGFGAGATATVANLMSAFQTTTGMSLDAKQRKARIQFWTTLCIISCAILALVGIVGTAMMAAVPSIAQGVYEKSAVRIRSPFGDSPNFGPSYEKAEEAVKQRVSVFIFVLFVPALIAYLCCYYFYLHRLWEEIPGEIARTTPGNAAGFALIPFYNYYWQFIAFRGLYRNMNETVESYGSKPRFEESMVHTACVVWIVLGIIGLINNAITSVDEDMITEPGFVGWLVILGLASAAFTIWVYWFVRRDVLEFIDIKSGAGQ
jgi:hypothetical protein